MFPWSYQIFPCRGLLFVSVFFFACVSPWFLCTSKVGVCPWFVQARYAFCFHDLYQLGVRVRYHRFYQPGKCVFVTFVVSNVCTTSQDLCPWFVPARICVSMICTSQDFCVRDLYQPGFLCPWFVPVRIFCFNDLYQPVRVGSMICTGCIHDFCATQDLCARGFCIYQQWCVSPWFVLTRWVRVHHLHCVSHDLFQPGFVCPMIFVYTSSDFCVPWLAATSWWICSRFVSIILYQPGVVWCVCSIIWTSQGCKCVCPPQFVVCANDHLKWPGFLCPSVVYTSQVSVCPTVSAAMWVCLHDYHKPSMWVCDHD